MAKKDPIQSTIPDPTTLKVEKPSDYLERGWLYFSRQNYEQAAADYQEVLTTEPEHIDALYSLGLTLKNQGESKRAVEIFEKILGLLPHIDDHQRASVLSRLVKGQINMMKTGDWNLEKEVWHRVK